MDSGLKGKVVLVTGASGGIGAAIARAFAREEARVVVHYYKGKENARELVKQIGDDSSVAVRANLASEPDVARLFSKAVERFGTVDTVVCNAASWETRDVPLHQMALKQWRSTMDGVLTSTFLTMRAFLGVVARRKRGNAVLIGSTAAVFGEAGHCDYAAAKGAIAYGLTRSLKNELSRIAPHKADYCGGRVNCVCPGWTAVARLAKKLSDPVMVRKATATMALPQIGRPEDMANAVVFLASDTLARHITGQTLVIAGGMEGRWLWQPEEVDPSIA